MVLMVGFEYSRVERLLYLTPFHPTPILSVLERWLASWYMIYK